MHPIICNKTRFAAYMLVWVLIGGLLTGLLRMPGTLTLGESAELAAPLCLLYAFFCLTPWYMCRHLPLVTTNPLKIIVQHLAAALLACGIWVKLANFIARQGMHANARFQMEAAVHGVGGASLHVSGAAGFARGGAAGARCGVAGAEGADQSAFFV
jgi:hypothetical protein